MSKQDRATKAQQARKDWLGSFSAGVEDSLEKALETIPQDLSVDDDPAFRKQFATICSSTITLTDPENSSSNPFHTATNILEDYCKTLWQTPTQIDESVKKKLASENHPVPTLGENWQTDFDALAGLIETGNAVTKRRIDELVSRDAGVCGKKRAKVVSSREETAERVLKLGTGNTGEAGEDVGGGEVRKTVPVVAVLKDANRAVRRMTKRLAQPVEEKD
ncbi:MAG: hypothetical protein M1831_006870 [Alyxoria varia]|nr:MAG: hypothetical protein M1831_006870 [Alyxoria varia]